MGRDAAGGRTAVGQRLTAIRRSREPGRREPTAVADGDRQRGSRRPWGQSLGPLVNSPWPIAGWCRLAWLCAAPHRGLPSSVPDRSNRARRKRTYVDHALTGTNANRTARGYVPESRKAAPSLGVPGTALVQRYFHVWMQLCDDDQLACRFRRRAADDARERSTGRVPGSACRCLVAAGGAAETSTVSSGAADIVSVE
jgi:hypothetical protein